MKNIYLVFSLIVSINTFCQQSGQTENYILNKLGSNPALAGFDNTVRVAAIGQYGSGNEVGTMKNYYLSAELPILKSFGTSVQYSDYSYRLTDSKTLTFGIAKHLKLAENSTLSIGINGGFSNTKFDFTSDYAVSLAQSNPFDKSQSFISGSAANRTLSNFSQNQYLIGAGLYLNHLTWHLGFSVPNIIKNQIPDYLDPNKKITLERPGFLSLQKDMKLNDNLSLTAGGLYRFSKINASQKGLDLQASIWLKEKYSVGLWYQRIGAKQTSNVIEKKPLVLVAEMIVKKMRLGYSFNFNENANSFTNIKQQIMFRIDIDYLKKRPSF